MSAKIEAEKNIYTQFFFSLRNNFNGVMMSLTLYQIGESHVFLDVNDVAWLDVIIGMYTSLSLNGLLKGFQ